MLSNPYPHPLDSATSDDNKLQCDISGEHKSDLTRLRPRKGTIQLIVSNLVYNLWLDLHELTGHFYDPNGDELLAILTERRPLTPDQLDRFRRSSSGAVKEISEGVQQHRGGPSVRAPVAATETGSGHSPKSPKVGKRHSRTKESKSQEGGETKVE